MEIDVFTTYTDRAPTHDVFMMEDNRLKFYKLHPDVKLPYFATTQSACFDIIFNSAHTMTYTGYSGTNVPFERDVVDGEITIMPKERVLVPTGLIFDIPKGYSVRVHARSGLSLKKGLVLVNSEGVIDSDYVDELFVMLTNITDAKIKISTGDRVAQGEMVETLVYQMTTTDIKPVQKTDRVGGLGSTGITAMPSLAPTYDINTPVTPTTPVLLTEEQPPPVKRRGGRPKGSPNKNPYPHKGKKREEWTTAT